MGCVSFIKWKLLAMVEWWRCHPHHHIRDCVCGMLYVIMWVIIMLCANVLRIALTKREDKPHRRAQYRICVSSNNTILETISVNSLSECILLAVSDNLALLCNGFGCLVSYRNAMRFFNSISGLCCLVIWTDRKRLRRVSTSKNKSCSVNQL